MIIQMIKCIHTAIRNKTSEQFIDFIRRIDSKYNSSIKTIFVVLDNVHLYTGQKRQEMQ